ncbi:MAG: 50S ribosomal protein L6 [Sphaerochaetaceae bacterium]|nr:50S ribosomal protein L6 [Sphaerochaetaceae bacterium]MDC7236864.1 50S ribosomal protein L6 [Sphaerochaetaceae bacterium]MDC7243977.1 50S ribosomal protein L6 [Sphaerochaetaceae bacterium]
MSRIGKMPVALPAGVKVTVKDGILSVEGPKGKLTQEVRKEVSFDVQKEQIVVTRKDESKASRSFHGLYRQLLNNMIVGVTKGYTKNLIVNGVGYRAEVKGNLLVLNLGYSNIIEFVIPEGITITVEGQNKIAVSAIDKQLVGQTAAEIRSLRKPEPYKGKGVRYEDEVIRRKVGKSGK